MFLISLQNIENLILIKIVLSVIEHILNKMSKNQWWIQQYFMNLECTLLVLQVFLLEYSIKQNNLRIVSFGFVNLKILQLLI